VLTSKWFTKGGQYLSFHTPGYLSEVTGEDLAKSRQWMNQVVAKAGTPEQKARARILMLAFEYYENSALAYRGKRPVNRSSLRTEADVLALIEESQQIITASGERQRILTNAFQKVPALKHALSFDKHPNLRGDDWGGNRLWTAFDWIEKSPAVRVRLNELAQAPSASVQQQARAMLAAAKRKPVVCSRNASFEEAQGNWPKDWSNWITDRAGKGTVSASAAHSGKQGLVYTGVKRGGPHQTVEVPPGYYCATAMVRVPKPIAGQATISLKMAPMDEQGRNLSEIATSLNAVRCDWTPLTVTGEIKAEYSGRPVKKVRLIVILDGFGPAESVEMDDVVVSRLSEP
jgi:hypothetical protein